MDLRATYDHQSTLPLLPVFTLYARLILGSIQKTASPQEFLDKFLGI